MHKSALLVTIIQVWIINTNVIFPKDKTDTPIIKESVKNSSICEPENYPSKVISNLIKKNIGIGKLFDQLDTRSQERMRKDDNVCDTNTEYITPKAARNKAGQFVFIVNSPVGSEEYFQLVKVTKCANDGEECAQGQLLGYIDTMCKQEYSDHKLVALSETGSELVVDTFSFPSCCSCVFNHHLELRVETSLIPNPSEFC